MTPAQIVERAQAGMAWRDSKGNYVRYNLKDYNGGYNPDAPDVPGVKHPKTGYYVSDCLGFAYAWVFKRPRKVPGFNRGGTVDDWVNTDSIVEDAMGLKGKPAGNELFMRTWVPRVGDLVVYRSRWRRLAGVLKKDWGHIGLVVRVPDNFNPSVEKEWDAMQVIHCNKSSSDRLGRAIVRSSGTIFRANTLARGCFVRVKGSEP